MSCKKNIAHTVNEFPKKPALTTNELQIITASERMQDPTFMQRPQQANVMQERQEWSRVPDRWQVWQMQEEAFLSLATELTGEMNQAWIVL